MAGWPMLGVSLTPVLLKEEALCGDTAVGRRPVGRVTRRSGEVLAYGSG